jgi:hypothetical protein
MSADFTVATAKPAPMAQKPSASTKPMGRRRNNTAAMMPAPAATDAVHSAGSCSAAK